jgi:hypothetical protein
MSINLSKSLKSSYNKEGVCTGISGKLWKLNDKGFLKGSRPWKRRWVESDGTTLKVWSTDEEVGSAKYTIELYSATVEEVHFPKRENVFTVRTTPVYGRRNVDDDSSNITFSADSVADLEEWIHFLVKYTREGDRDDGEEEDHKKDKNGDEEEAKNSKDDTDTMQRRYIMNFFLKHNVSSSETNPVIPEHLVEELVQEVSGVMPGRQTEAIMKYFYRRTGMVAVYVSLEDFLEFLDVFQGHSFMTLSSSALPAPVTTAVASPSLEGERQINENLGNHYTESSLTLGIIDPVLRSTDLKPSMVELMRGDVPNVKKISLVDGPGPDSVIFMNGHANWNEWYQKLLSEASLANPTDTMLAEPSEDGDNGAAGDAGEPRTVFVEPSKEDILDNVSACLQLAALQGAFLQTATEGAQIIVDEYTLPDRFKTTQVLHHHHHHDEAEAAKKKRKSSIAAAEFQKAEVESDTDDSTLISEGLEDEPTPVVAFTLEEYIKQQIGKNTESGGGSSEGGSSRDDEDDLDNEIEVSDSEDSSTEGGYEMEVDARGISRVINRDDEVHVDADHIYKGLIFSIIAVKPDSSVDTHPTEQRLKQLAATDILLHKTASNEHRGSVVLRHALGKSPQREMIRVTMSTVVDYGGFRVQVMCPLALPENSLVQGSSVENPNIQGMLSNLFSRMNIETFSQDVPAAAPVANKKFELFPSIPTNTADNSNNGNPTSTKQVFPEGLEVHIDESGEDYVVNMSHVLPMELPRPHTSDIQTRRIRPEFLASYHTAFKTDTVDTVEVDDAASLFEEEGENEYKQHEEEAGEMRVLEARASPLLECMKNFYTRTVPDLARALDTLSTLPFDSYSLSQCFHSYGVGMHHLGTVYSMSKSRVTRRFLLCEAIARCAKVIISNILRDILRKEKAVTLVAELRERSERADYIDHMNDVQLRKEAKILEFYNLVFGSSQESSTFWKVVLPDMAFQKFSLVLPTALQALTKTQFLHLPQLFLAMQYHTGVLFLDHCEYPFDNPPAEPFKRSDVINFFRPCAKDLSHSQNKLFSSGYVGHLDALAESYLGADLPEEAARLFRLRLSLQLTSGKNFTSHKSAKAIASTSYKLALALYLSGDYPEATKVIQADMKQHPRFTALNGRFLTLLMCSQFMNGDVEEALESYDAGAAVYSYSMGPHHPMQAIHLCALADLYCKAGCYKNCSLTLTMAADVAQHSVGDGHLLTVSYMYKIAANTYTLAHSEGREFRSLHLENALEAFEDVLATYVFCSIVLPSFSCL